MTFNFVNLRNTPFYMASLSVILLGFLLAFIGTAIIAGSGLMWFSVLYTLLVILAVGWVVGSSTLFQYRLALLSLITINVMLAINHTHTFIYGAGASNALVGAGYIFIGFIEFIWIIAIGSDDGSAVYMSLNRMLVLPSTAYPSQAGAYGRPQPATMTSTGPTHQAHTTIAMPTPMAPAGVGQPFAANDRGNATGSPGSSQVNDVEYLYRAKAKYAYTANPEDNTELSFAKDDVLEIADNKGKWWHARKADGSIGVVPSNYVELIGPNNA
ncbi:hypothetical protein THASP1DRAFT_31426 [Thamnocephalis sphaerospora]|uniref:SH3 domain-containing protein n=1 Tax=Thamnocephalis sphaerospora TaxID=78915 RepID=A0A4P9XLS4_9FUNG|nr:hypothetical protein THASP1DRAFT_31426 [Thamnocephalis sphaerospora]|eukprot:RKP06766.1 hypothetical protein THASP1DRAFT_31426 [Thamnocephalis sphaerospora]